jgi:hypothetical protein
MTGMNRSEGDFLHYGDVECDKLAAILSSIDIPNAVAFSARPDYEILTSDDGEIVYGDDGLRTRARNETLRLAVRLKISERAAFYETSIPRAMVADLDAYSVMDIVTRLTASAVELLARRAIHEPGAPK